ncbi:MAG: HpcH/HpaI aldolase/citrate lyase family protein [Alphaproteobacteria bacterium]
MRANPIREIWAAGGAVINGWLAVPSSFSAEVMAHAGWDSLCVDLQHGVNDYQTAIGMFQAISTTKTVPICRVPWSEPGIVGKMLDGGAYGVIAPMVNNAAEAAAFASYTRYPPLGQRSFGPIRGLLYGGADYAEHANDTIVALAQVETREAIDNLDAMCAVRDLDGLYIGPADLALSFGKKPAFDTEDPEMWALFMRVRDACRKAGKVACIHCGSPAYAARMAGEGFQLMTVLSDARLMAAGAAAAVKALREGGGAGGPSGSGY